MSDLAPDQKSYEREPVTTLMVNEAIRSCVISPTKKIMYENYRDCLAILLTWPFNLFPSDVEHLTLRDIKVSRNVGGFLYVNGVEHIVPVEIAEKVNRCTTVLFGPKKHIKTKHGTRNRKVFEFRYGFDTVPSLDALHENQTGQMLIYSAIEARLALVGVDTGKYSYHKGIAANILRLKGVS